MHDLKVSVAEILGRPGEYRDIAVSPTLEGVSTALARLDESPVRATLRAESVVEGVLVAGRAVGRSRMRCARCLRSFDEPVDVEVCELFYAPGHGAKEEDAYEMVGSDIDLEPMLRDTVTLSLPLNPLCKLDCKGLCATCGRDLNETTCDCRTDESDPRWAPLDALRDQLQG